jgi:hypothetical protein|tara:strand:+ start:3487 stop:3981 length:495 start_codon:yes stop_codon:yes gene_type:complete
MANQNPQPEIYTTTHAFASTATAGTQNIQTVFTNQNSSEEVRIYSIAVNRFVTGLGEDMNLSDADFTARIQIGNSYVPSQAFDISCVMASDSKTIVFPTPILVLFQQPISVEVAWNGGFTQTTVGQNVTVKTTLMAELSIAQVACMDCGMEHPQSSGCPIRRGA